MSAKESDHMQATHIQAYDGGNAKEMQKEKKKCKKTNVRRPLPHIPHPDQLQYIAAQEH